MKKVSANQEKESFAKAKNPRRKTTAQQQARKHEKECEKKIEKANSKNLQRFLAKKEQTLMLVFTSKYTIIFCAFMQAKQQRLDEKGEKNPPRHKQIIVGIMQSA